MRNFLYIILLSLTFASCSESYLDTDNYTKKTDVTFYQTPEDVSAALTACYSVMPLISTSQSFFLVSELMSDDRFGGGGVGDRGFLSTDAFKKADENQYSDAWAKYYQGIFRCNMLLENIDKPKWASADQKGQAEGEARFLRAYFYFDLVRMFGDVPLILKTAPVNIPRTPVAEVYAQIGTDLKAAIEAFPKTKYSTSSTANLGHATRWAAEGLMARAFLFYTGYYNQTSLPLVGGGSVAKADVVAWIDECVQSSGHALISKFGNLWPYSNALTKPDYPYAKKNDLAWVGEKGDNTETVFAVKFSTLASWAATSSIYYSNQTDLYFGMRSKAYLPFGQGWGAGPVSPLLWEDWNNDPDYKNDPRIKGSICNVADADENVKDYDPKGWEQMHETGLWQKKYMPITYNNGGKYENYSTAMYGFAPNYQLDNTQDLVIIRFSDILLMGAELGKQEYLDAVRSRAGLPSIPATLANVKKERRYELAFEGVRYHDLLRWHDAEAAFNRYNSSPVQVRNNGVFTTYKQTYRPETGGFLPIPNSEIQLSGGVLKQTPGWSDASSNY